MLCYTESQYVSTSRTLALAPVACFVLGVRVGLESVPGPQVDRTRSRVDGGEVELEVGLGLPLKNTG